MKNLILTLIVFVTTLSFGQDGLQIVNHTQNNTTTINLILNGYMDGDLYDSLYTNGECTPDDGSTYTLGKIEVGDYNENDTLLSFTLDTLSYNNKPNLYITSEDIVPRGLDNLYDILNIADTTKNGSNITYIFTQRTFDSLGINYNYPINNTTFNIALYLRKYDANDPHLTPFVIELVGDELSTKEESITDINVYPNPVSNILNVDFSSNKNVDAKLYSMSGKLLEINNSINNTKFDMSKYDSGLYILKIGNITRKVIK